MSNLKFKFNIYKIREWADDIFFEIHNLLALTRFIYYLIKWPIIRKLLRQNKKIKNLYKNKKIFILTSGPSINNLDLNKIQDDLIITVNRGYKHPLFKKFSPIYHLFVDNKLEKGEWDLNWLKEIKELSPKTTILLNARWIRNKALRNFVRENNINCNFIYPELYPTRLKFFRNFDNLTSISLSMGVVGSAVLLAIYLGAKKIVILGKDSNGLLYEMLKKDSHFYGVNDDNNKKKIADYCIDLFLMSCSLRMWNNFADICKNKAVKIYNASKYSLLESFEKISFEDSLKI